MILRVNNKNVKNNGYIIIIMCKRKKIMRANIEFNLQINYTHTQLLCTMYNKHNKMSCQQTITYIAVTCTVSQIIAPWCIKACITS